MVLKIRNQDEPWAPYAICKISQVNFIYWESGPSSSFKFGVPMIWQEPTNCINDCYPCLVKTAEFNVKNKQLLKYPNILSVICPVTHLLEVPTPATSFTSEDMDQHMESDVHLPFDGHTKRIQETSLSSSTVNQAKLNDLVCDLGLSKVKIKGEKCSCSWV